MSRQFLEDIEVVHDVAGPAIAQRMKKLEREHAAVKKAAKIDAFALAKELGSKISLNFNEWKMIARAVEAQLRKPK